MKALDILNKLKEDYEYNIEDTDFVDEAIAEQEALQQPKSCEGCKYEHKDAYSLPCAACVRSCDSDYYEPKEQ